MENSSVLGSIGFSLKGFCLKFSLKSSFFILWFRLIKWDDGDLGVYNSWKTGVEVTSTLGEPQHGLCRILDRDERSPSLHGSIEYPFPKWSMDSFSERGFTESEAHFCGMIDLNSCWEHPIFSHLKLHRILSKWKKTVTAILCVAPLLQVCKPSFRDQTPDIVVIQRGFGSGEGKHGMLAIHQVIWYIFRIIYRVWDTSKPWLAWGFLNHQEYQPGDSAGDLFWDGQSVTWTQRLLVTSNDRGWKVTLNKLSDLESLGILGAKPLTTSAKKNFTPNTGGLRLSHKISSEDKTRNIMEHLFFKMHVIIMC